MPRSLDLLHVLVNEIILSLSACLSNNWHSANVICCKETITHFEHLNSKIKQCRLSQKDSRKTKRVAVLGYEQTGKTTLVNKLIGKNILPCGVSAHTECIVEIKNNAYDYNHPNPTIVVYNLSNSVIAREILPLQEDRFCDALAQTIANLGNISKIEIAYPFVSKYLLEDSVLIDTPSYGKIDKKRLSNVINSADIPIFCIHSNYIGTENDRKFFSAYLRNRNSINAIIDFESGRSNEDKRNRLNDAVERYKMDFNSTLFVPINNGFDKCGLDKLFVDNSCSPQSLHQEFNKLLYEVNRDCYGFTIPKAEFENYKASLDANALRNLGDMGATAAINGGII